FPSTSPENLWRTADGAAVSLTEGAGMDRWLLRENARQLLDAAALLGRTQDPVVQRAASALELVPGPRIGADGRVLEWHRDGLAEVEPHHRHVSHLGFLYPGEDVPEPRHEQAATRALEARGDEATGWSLVWKAALWARLRRADRVQSLLELYLRPAEAAEGTERSGLYPNLFSAHPPFQIDGNLGIVAALAECLLQSHRGEIELLPAVPPLLADGSVRGLRARPGIAVDMTWEGGALTSLRLRATGPGALGTHRVRCGEATVEVELTDLQPVEVPCPQRSHPDARSGSGSSRPRAPDTLAPPGVPPRPRTRPADEKCVSSGCTRTRSRDGLPQDVHGRGGARTDGFSRSLHVGRRAGRRGARDRATRLDGAARGGPGRDRRGAQPSPVR